MTKPIKIALVFIAAIIAGALIANTYVSVTARSRETREATEEINQELEKLRESDQSEQ
ncbi:MAG: hypothetical protein AAGF24_05710 [Cyanobacteria bacterium P01_H01_bin.121]